MASLGRRLDRLEQAKPSDHRPAFIFIEAGIEPERITGIKFSCEDEFFELEGDCKNTMYTKAQGLLFQTLDGRAIRLVFVEYLTYEKCDPASAH